MVASLTESDPRQLGKYWLVGRLGSGGQGVVYLGRTEVGDSVAVKVLNQESLRDAHARRMFQREAQAATRVAGFCTAQVLDAVMTERHAYIVSEYVAGPSVRELVARAGPLPDSALLRLAVGTVTALTAIHRAGVVHRDFKPSNVLVGPDGPRVVDFGISRMAGSAVTQPGRLIGTPAYMAPEQLLQADVGPEADVFGWACTMVFAGCGRPPFGDDAIPAVIDRILRAEPELPFAGSGLRATLLSCLDKRPQRRPPAQDILLGLLDGVANDFAGPGRDRSPAEFDPGSALAAGATRAADLITLLGVDPPSGRSTVADEVGAVTRVDPDLVKPTTPLRRDRPARPGVDPDVVGPARPLGRDTPASTAARTDDQPPADPQPDPAAGRSLPIRPGRRAYLWFGLLLAAGWWLLPLTFDPYSDAVRATPPSLLGAGLAGIAWIRWRRAKSRRITYAAGQAPPIRPARVAYLWFGLLVAVGSSLVALSRDLLHGGVALGAGLLGLAWTVTRRGRAARR